MSLIVDIQKQLGAFSLNVSFKVENGITGILGASGCGKSVTLRCIAGIETPDHGHIELDGRTLFDSSRNIDLLPQERRVGYLFQNYALFPNMTVKQNIAVGVRQREKRKTEAERLVRSFRLSECANKYPFQLSGGQQQRTALARILASQPAALLLDEPFSALDSFLKWQIELELAERLSDFSGPVLFVTHDREEICHQCQNVCVLEHGKSQPVVTVDALFHTPQTRSACQLSGCENISEVKRTADGRLEALDWGIVLEADQPLPEHLTHVGIRACHLCLTDRQGVNCFPYHRLREIKGPVSDTVLLSLSQGHIPMRMDVEKGAGSSETLFVELPSSHLLLLSS